MKLRVLALVALAVLTSARAANAGYEFRFADNTGAYQNAFNIATVGGTVDIQVYLVATGGSPLADLRSYGVQLNYNGLVADVTSNANITSNAGFTGPDQKLTTAAQSATDSARSADATPGPTWVASAAGPGGDPRVLLATFKFTGISGGTTSNLTSDPFVAANTVTGTTNTVLDGFIVNANATITVVPEPGTFVLTGLLAAGVAGGAVRRFRRKTAA